MPRKTRTKKRTSKMSDLEKSWDDTPDLTAEQMTTMLESLDKDTPDAENHSSEEKRDRTAEETAWLNAMFEPLERETPASDRLGLMVQNLSPEGRRILQDPANIPMPSLIGLSKALHTLRTDMTPESVTGLELVASRYKTYTLFTRRLRVEGTRTGLNTPFKRKPDETILRPIDIPEVRRLHNVLESFPLVSEFELALGPTSIPFRDTIHPGDVPKCLFRVINSLRRHITHLSFIMEADDWHIETPVEFQTPYLYDCVLEDLDELRVQWPYFPDEEMDSPPRTPPHPWLMFLKRLFRTQLRMLILEGGGRDGPCVPVGPTFNAIPVDGCNLRDLTLTKLVLTDCDMCILIPKITKLESITLDQVRFEGDWPQMLRMLANLCPCLRQFKFQEVEWASDHHDDNAAHQDNTIRVSLSGSSEDKDFDKTLYSLATDHHALRCSLSGPL